MALVGDGRQAEAQTEYERFCRILAGDWQLTPSPETIALAEKLRSPQSLKPPQTRSRAQQILLEKTRKFWIEGVLEQSLHGAALIELGKETRPDALDYPWGMVLQRPSIPPQTIPPNTSLYDLFQRHGPLLILGAPGSGKTTMLLDLARSAITQAQPENAQPIPAIFNLSSWALTSQSLKEWLTAELNDKYLIPPNIGRQWLDDDQLLLLLDGLDEVKADKQTACIDAINQFRAAHGLVQIVVCSRLADYEKMAAKLRLETAVHLQPLTPAQIDAYLQTGDKSLTTMRQTIQQDPHLQEMAQSPLMLSIMALAYRHLPAEDLSGQSTSQNRRQHLFDTYVIQMGRRKGETYHYSLDETRRWLSWIAQKLHQQDQTIFMLEMLQPGWLDGRGHLWLYIFITRLTGGLLIALLITAEPAMLIFGLTIGLLISILTGRQFQKQKDDPLASPGRLPLGKTFLPIAATITTLILSAGLMLGINTGSAFFALLPLSLIWLPFGLLLELRDHKRTPWNDIQTVELLSWSWARARRTAVRGVVIGTIGGLAFGLLLALSTSGLYNNLLNTILSVALLGLPLGLSMGLLTGFSRDVIPLKTTPDQGFRLTLRLILSGTLFGAVGIGLLAGIIFFASGEGSRWQEALFIAWLGLKFGLLVGLWYGGLDLIYHAILRLMLWRQGRLPLRLISFLDEAAQHLYLRKVGNGYIFVHRLLLDYFAGRYDTTL